VIDIRITADTVEEFHQALIGLLAGTSAAPAAAAPAATRGRGKKAEDKPEPPTAPQGEETREAQVGDAQNTSGVDAKSTDPITKDALSKRFLELGSKAGPAAAKELLTEFGVPKFSELPEDKYPAMSARLDELLAQPAA